MKAFYKPVLFLNITLIAAFFSCKDTEEYRTPEMETSEMQDYLSKNLVTEQPKWTGLYYIEKEAGSGNLPSFNDTLIINYTLSRLDGSSIGSSEQNNAPLTLIYRNNNFIYGLDIAAGYMKKGAQAQVIIPSGLAYGYFQQGEIEPYTTLIYNLEVTDIKPGLKVEPYNTDTTTLHTTKSGLGYYIVKSDTGRQIVAGDYITVHYTGYLKNGDIFDSSVKRKKTVNFQIGIGDLIPGWDEGIVLMKVGEKYRFVIPPNLAYGATGKFPIIPPDETITFDVELIKVL